MSFLRDLFSRLGEYKNGDGKQKIIFWIITVFGPGSLIAIALLIIMLVNPDLVRSFFSLFS